MPKSCCVYKCNNEFEKGNGLHFYHLPSDKSRRLAWIAAISRKGWSPTEFSLVCSDHFISGRHKCYAITILCTSRGLIHVGEKSNDPCHPDYVPTIFSYIKDSEKNRAKCQRQLERYEVAKSMKAKRRKAGVRQGQCKGRE